MLREKIVESKFSSTSLCEDFQHKIKLLQRALCEWNANSFIPEPWMNKCRAAAGAAWVGSRRPYPSQEQARNKFELGKDMTDRDSFLLHLDKGP